ncbi:phosphatase PAP2 family protein [Thermococcus sp. GR6]|uniref:phosphatase PAP2 family protein n=1 Tax=Thermococcus sp. GR6 TaxID=1638256 RepID=UPI001430022E|nr:phosphatase PAP2 family protein [Thermococcus sp. GR6]NJE42070.1 phosphatase PAP2 family protein [Thermococcus sp. GR6]
MLKLQELTNDWEILVRLNAFFISYFGWLLFGLAYGFLGRYSVDVTHYLIHLPFTSRDFVIGLIEFTKSLPLLYWLFEGVYYLGFSGSIALIVAYLLLYKRDLEASDELFIRYMLSYTVAGSIYLIVHVHAPHLVYNLPGYISENTYLTRQEFVLPSLHNTFAMVNIITLWKYRREKIGATLIVLNSLIPFTTLFLGHHWIYDIITGMILAVVVSKLTAGYSPRLPAMLCGLELSYLRRLAVLSFFIGVIALFLAADPQYWSQLVSNLLGTP